MTVITINSDNLSVTLSDYGARILRIKFADQELSLHYPEESSFRSDDAYLGATIAPITNRISEGRLSVGGKVFQLPLNEGTNTLHSGGAGADKIDWKVDSIEKDCVVFGVDMELETLGMQGNLSLKTKYQVSGNDLLIEYQAQCSEDTYVNTTNHVYLNLSGSSLAGSNRSIQDHIFTLYGQSFVDLDTQSIPTGTVTQLDNSPLKYSIDKKNAHQEFDGMIDHHFNVADAFSDSLEIMAGARSQSTGISLEVHSNAPGYQFYTGKFLQGSFVESGGFCIETQLAPDAINQANFYSPILKAGEVRLHKTVLKFDVYA